MVGIYQHSFTLSYWGGVGGRADREPGTNANLLKKKGVTVCYFLEAFMLFGSVSCLRTIVNELFEYEKNLPPAGHRSTNCPTMG